MNVRDDIFAPTNAPLIPRALPVLRCPDCRQSAFEWFTDDSMAPDLTTHGALVCTACSTCFRYHDGVLEFLKSRPETLTRAQRSNFSAMVYRNYQNFWRTWIMSVLTAERFPNDVESGVLKRMVEPDLDANGILLDIGTAHGSYALSLASVLKTAPHDGFVIAVDFSLGMLTEAVKRAEALGVQDRVLFVLSDVENLPLRDRSVDGITCGGGLNEYGRVEIALREVRRVMKDDSKFVAMHLHRGKGVYALLQELIHHTSGLRFPELKDWAALFEKASFQHQVHAIKGIVSWTMLTPS